MPCYKCGRLITQDAHVRDYSDFENWESDRLDNIIPLCFDCHTAFDNGLIGITQNKKYFVELNDNDLAILVAPAIPIFYIRDKYIIWKNKHCVLKIRLALGLIKGFEHYSIVPKD